MFGKSRIPLVFGLLICSGTALAFVPTGFRWRLPVPYEVNTNSAQELGGATALQVVQASYANWSAPACSGFSSVFQGETNGSWQSGDGMNTLLWIYDPAQRPRELGGSSTIGVTLSTFRGNSALDGDILFNGIDHRWTTNASRRGDVDAISIITHETGHQLGLNHSPDQSATMYAAYLGGNGAATLAADDVNGVCSLYPSGQAAECQADGDCPAGERCVGGACVEQGQGGDGAIGDPCGRQGGECQGGLFCVRTQAGSSFCTRQCQGQCPEGWDCQGVTLNGQRTEICLPGAGGGNSGGAGFGDACRSSRDCATGFCISDGRTSICSQACGSDADCPPGGECLGVRGGGGACAPGDDPPPVPDAAVPPPPIDMFVQPTPPDAAPLADAGVTVNPGTGNGMNQDGGAGLGGTLTIVPARKDSGCHCDVNDDGSPLWFAGLILLFGWCRRRAPSVSVSDLTG